MSRDQRLVEIIVSKFRHKFNPAGQGYPRVVELPTFGHSDNHVCLQRCDIVCSSLLHPIACFAYCTGRVNNVHIQSAARNLRQRHGNRLKSLQYRNPDISDNRYRGGLVVADAIGHRMAR